MRLEHHLVGGYVRYISPYIIIIIHLKLGHRLHALLKVCSDRDDIVSLNIFPWNHLVA